MIAVLKIWGEYGLGDPFFLLALPLFGLLWWWRARRGGRPALLWGALALRHDLPRGWRVRLVRLTTWLEALACIALVLALARPQKLIERVEVNTKGVDIVVCLDVSGSMAMPDLDEKEKRSRLDVVKEVAEKFIKGRRGDRIGLVSFGLFPQVVCPSTLDLDAACRFLDTVEIAKGKMGNRTAIGAGLMRSVALLHQSEARSRVVVLLTDGEENARSIKPADAANAAKQYKIKVHCMAAGRFDYSRDLFGRLHRQKQRLDTGDLEKIARTTGGTFHRVTDGEGMRQVWDRIDKMEKTELKDRRWVEADDLAGPVLMLGVLLLLGAFLGLSLGGLP